MCARCAKRGQVCQYFATRRAGRKHEPRPQAATALAWQSDSSNGGGKSNDSIIASSNGKPDGGNDAQNSIHVVVSSSAGTPNRCAPAWDLCLSEGITYPSPSHVLCVDGTTLPGDDGTSWRLLSSVIPDANDLFASPMSFPMPETPAQLFSLTGGEGQKSNNSAEKPGFDLGDCSSFLVPDVSLVLDESGPDLDQFGFSAVWDPPSSPSLSSLSSPPSSTSSSLANTQHPSTRDGSESHSHGHSRSLSSASSSSLAGSPGCCLIRSLELLKKLFPGSAACTCNDGSVTEPYSSGHHIPTIQRVITENKLTLETVQGMLQCLCADSDGSYLLAVISLVVFKVLGWYRAAVKDLPTAVDRTWKEAPGSPKTQSALPPSRLCRRSSCHAEHVLQVPAIIDGYRLDGDDQARMAAQLVLSELHRVQRLINVLANRLKSDEGGKSASNPTFSAIGHDEMPFFSQAWFSHLETDLRKQVRSLSLEIVELLKQ